MADAVIKFPFTSSVNHGGAIPRNLVRAMGVEKVVQLYALHEKLIRRGASCAVEFENHFSSNEVTFTVKNTLGEVAVKAALKETPCRDDAYMYSLKLECRDQPVKTFNLAGTGTPDTLPATLIPDLERYVFGAIAEARLLPYQARNLSLESTLGALEQ